VKKLVTPFRVGLLVLFSGALLFYLISFVRKGGMDPDESLRVYAVFQDASGLGKRSRVQIAGIAVGEIDDIQLVGKRAKVWLKIKREVVVRDNASIAKRSESLLGDYMLDLDPGYEPSVPLKDGDEIKKVIDKQGMDAAMDSLSRISADIEQVTYALRKSLGGDKGAESIEQIVKNIESITAGLDRTVAENERKLSAILSDAERISHDLAGITANQRANVESILVNVEVVSRDAREVVAAVKKLVGTGSEGEDVKETVASLRSTVEKLERTISNVEEVSQKIKEGKGTAGALLSDERLGQKISETVDDVAAFAQTLTQTKVEVGLRAEYGFGQGSANNTLGVRIIPKPDKYYLIEIVDDARDVVEEVVIQQNPPAAGQPGTQIQRITRDQVKFTAQFAKRYYFTTLRFGITENSGGVGADLHFFNDALTLKLDAFNFSVTTLQYPRLRGALRLHLLDHIVLSAGIDDVLNTPMRDAFSNRLIAGRDIFLGGGIYFTDDDIKAILTFVPLPGG